MKDARDTDCWNGHRMKQERGGSLMSEKMLRNLKELTESIENNRDTVRATLAKAGTSEPDSAIVSSAAKYHKALQMLADE